MEDLENLSTYSTERMYPEIFQKYLNLSKLNKRSFETFN